MPGPSLRNTAITTNTSLKAKVCAITKQNDRATAWCGGSHLQGLGWRLRQADQHKFKAPLGYAVNYENKQNRLQGAAGTPRLLQVCTAVMSTPATCSSSPSRNPVPLTSMALWTQVRVPTHRHVHLIFKICITYLKKRIQVSPE